jgi:hypothetical protein
MHVTPESIKNTNVITLLSFTLTPSMVNPGCLAGNFTTEEVPESSPLHMDAHTDRRQSEPRSVRLHGRRCSRTTHTCETRQYDLLTEPSVTKSTKASLLKTPFTHYGAIGRTEGQNTGSDGVAQPFQSGSLYLN